MKLRERYKRLILWNKIALWGSIASIAALLITFVTFFIPDSHTGKEPPKVSIKQSPGSIVTSQETAGNQNIVIAPGASVNVYQGESPEVIASLKRIVKEQGIALQNQEETIKQLVKKVKELDKRLSERSTENAKKGREKLNEGKFEEAEIYLVRSLQSYLEAGDNEAASRNAFDLAMLEEIQLKSEEAEKFYKQSKELQSLKDISLPGKTVNNPTVPPASSPETTSRTFINQFDMEFVYIQSGKFMMGSPKNEQGRYDREHQHQVTLTKDLYIQTTEVTGSSTFNRGGNI